jgi:hypothetical protein
LHQTHLLFLTALSALNIFSFSDDLCFFWPICNQKSLLLYKHFQDTVHSTFLRWSECCLQEPVLGSSLKEKQLTAVKWNMTGTLNWHFASKSIFIWPKLMRNAHSALLQT